MALTVGNVDAVLAASAASILTGAAADQITILKATVLNTDTVTRTITLYRVPLAGSPAVANELIQAFAVGPGQTVVLPLSGQTLVGGQSLQGLASVAAVVNINLSYTKTP
jgi:hypothetical protein